MHSAYQLTMLAGGGLPVSSPLPWTKITSTSGDLAVAGYQSDGLITDSIGAPRWLDAPWSPGNPDRRYFPALPFFGTLGLDITAWDLHRVRRAMVQAQGKGLIMTFVDARLYLVVLTVLLIIAGGSQTMPTALALSESPIPTLSTKPTS